MNEGWCFEMYKNALGSFTAVASNGAKEIITDHFTWQELIKAIVIKIKEA